MINTISDTPELSVTVDGQRAWNHSPFGSNTGYQSISAGSYAVRVDMDATGSDFMAANPMTFDAKRSYTVLALGLTHSAQFPAKVEVISDDLDGQVPPDKARVRFINAAPGFGQADLLLNNIVGVKEIAYNKRSDPVMIDGGDYDLKVNPAQSADTAFGPISLTFENGRAYTLVLVGQENGSNFSLESYPDNG